MSNLRPGYDSGAGREFHWATTSAVAVLVPGTTLASQMVRNAWEVRCDHCWLGPQS